VAGEGGGLPELVDALRWRWKLGVLIALPIFAGAVVYAQGLPAQYDGVAVVSISPKPGEGAELVRVGAPKYVAYVTAPATVHRVAPEIGEEANVIEHSLGATVATDTGNITITVELPSASRAAAAANAMARDAVAFSSSDRLLSAQLIAPAVVPTVPAGPPRKLIEAAALLVGILLGVAGAFVFERSRPRVRTWRDVAILTGYPVMGRLPGARALRTSPVRALSDPAVGAAARTLRTNLERELGGQPRGVFVVTSSISGEGKTTVATLLASALARLHSRVLLVDADLRRPEIGRGFGLDGEAGLSGVLRGKASLSESVRPGWSDGMAVLPTAADPDAGDLLARNFGDVLREAREQFDVVIVDSPPLIGTDDTRTMVTFTDGVLLVTSAGTMAAPVSEAVLALYTLRVRVVGAVANRVRDVIGGAAYGYYASPS
jgi:tyrosine-protein kinase